jgi:hypothetical protein
MKKLLLFLLVSCIALHWYIKSTLLKDIHNNHIKNRTIHVLNNQT